MLVLESLAKVLVPDRLSSAAQHDRIRHSFSAIRVTSLMNKQTFITEQLFPLGVEFPAATSVLDQSY